MLMVQVIVRGGLGFLLSWLANFKLLAFSAGRGPLAIPGLSFLQWAAMLVLPIFPAKRERSCVQLKTINTVDPPGMQGGGMSKRSSSNNQQLMLSNRTQAVGRQADTCVC